MEVPQDCRARHHSAGTSLDGGGGGVPNHWQHLFHKLSGSGSLSTATTRECHHWAGRRPYGSLSVFHRSSSEGKLHRKVPSNSARQHSLRNSTVDIRETPPEECSDNGCGSRHLLDSNTDSQQRLCNSSCDVRYSSRHSLRSSSCDIREESSDSPTNKKRSSSLTDPLSTDNGSDILSSQLNETSEGTSCRSERSSAQDTSTFTQTIPSIVVHGSHGNTVRADNDGTMCNSDVFTSHAGLLLQKQQQCRDVPNDQSK